MLKKKVGNYNEQIQILFSEFKMQEKKLSILEMKQENYFHIDFKFKEEFLMNNLYYPEGC